MIIEIWEGVFDEGYFVIVCTSFDGRVRLLRNGELLQYTSHPRSVGMLYFPNIREAIQKVKAKYKSIKKIQLYEGSNPYLKFKFEAKE